MGYLEGGYMWETEARDREREAKLNRKRTKDCTKNPNVYYMITFMHFYKVVCVSRNVKRKKIRCEHQIFF
jgi:hypothetical protein